MPISIRVRLIDSITALGFSSIIFFSQYLLISRDFLSLVNLVFGLMIGINFVHYILDALINYASKRFEIRGAVAEIIVGFSFLIIGILSQLELSRVENVLLSHYGYFGNHSIYLDYSYILWISGAILSHIINRIIALRNRPSKRERIVGKNPILGSFFDYYVIYCIYALTLSLLGGFLIYSFVFFTSKINYLGLVFYFVIEVILLYSNNATAIALESKTIEGFRSWRSWPTPGIFVASPLLLLYFICRLRDIDYFSCKGISKIWIISIYLITNPKLPKLNSDDNATLGKLIGLKLYSNHHITMKEITPAKSQSEPPTF